MNKWCMCIPKLHTQPRSEFMICVRIKVSTNLLINYDCMYQSLIHPDATGRWATSPVCPSPDVAAGWGTALRSGQHHRHDFRRQPTWCEQCCRAVELLVSNSSILSTKDYSELNCEGVVRCKLSYIHVCTHIWPCVKFYKVSQSFTSSTIGADTRPHTGILFSPVTWPYAVRFQNRRHAVWSTSLQSQHVHMLLWDSGCTHGAVRTI